MSDLAKKLNDFNKRFQIIEENDYKVEFEKFKTRIINILNGMMAESLDERVNMSFCNILGIDTEEFSEYSYSNIINAFKEEEKEIYFYKLIQILFYAFEENGYYGRINTLFEKVYGANELSNVNLSVKDLNGEIILYPRGEKEFDNKLVDEGYSFLNEEAQHHFIDALKYYQQSGMKNHIKSAESLRRTLEEYLRHKLDNTKGLAENIKELQKRIKFDGIESNIRNTVFSVFNYIDIYYNENSKHNDGEINSNTNEYLIYQTGILIRYIESEIK